ncbi:right-handed parallel beta-helix repeat-containing protein [Natrarchaeobius oligotrophus]|uniref:Right-handed parallel beta-helix repeat-containing protein n=1 Tax=Natrarchaeobius chitinivorans TaxID=1679083 RepID=A0A3N6MWL5_NATCH|nr:right-handed parallel beta-helix repeat-containing protein [Natrarchaeobius chitinivorans]
MLRTVAVAAASGIGLVAASEPTAAFHEGYDSVVDVVDEGADDTGSESITPVLEELRADDTAFVFPEGRYYVDSQFRFTGFENLGFFGRDATLVPANYHDFDGPQYRLFRLGVSYNPGRDLRFEGFDVDQSAPDTGIRVIEATVSRSLEVRDVSITGEHDSGTWGPGMFAVTDPDGRGVIERFRAPDGGVHADATPHAGNAWRGPIGIEANTNVGTLEFTDCVLGGFPDNGLYAVNETGTVVVQGGRFANSNGANVRLGGDGSVIKDAVIEVDRTRSYDDGQRGIRLENGDDLRVENVDVSISSPQPTSHAISVMNTCRSSRIDEATIEIRGDEVNHGIVVSPKAGYTHVFDGEIVHETAGGYPLWIRGGDGRERVLVELLDVSGESGVTAAGFRDGIRCERNGCRFSHVTVDQPARDGADRNGLVLTGDDATIYRGTVRASQYPYVDQGDGNHLRNSDVESYRDGLEGVRLYPGIDGPEFRVNRIANGIDDLGASDVLTWRNTYD